MNQHNSQLNVGSTGRTKNRLESAISISIIAFLLAISATLFVRQANTDVKRFGITAPNLQLTQKPVPEPDNSPVIQPPAGFNKLSEAEAYNAENLYEKIDGKAPLYTEAGFLKLYCQRFVNKTDANLWMEVFLYDMGNVRNAFSVYSMQRRADAKILPTFAQTYGYGTSNGLYFVCGHYYTEVVGSAESDILLMAMLETASNIQKNPMAAGDSKIDELDLFQSENLVPDSMQLYLKNAFGFEGLSDVFTAQYKIGDQPVTVFFSKRPNAEDAEAMAVSYRKFLMENGATVKQTTSEFLKNKVFDFYGVTEMVFTTGQFVVGVHEAENQDAAEKAAMILAVKLSNGSKVKQ
jgi:hypothetical protein